MNHSFSTPTVNLSAARHLAEYFSGKRKIVTINRTQKFSAQYRHIFRVAGTKKKMTFIGTGTTAYTAVHENFQGTEFFQPFLEAIEDDFFPVFRKFPIIIFGRPFPRIREVQPLLAVKIFYFILLSRIGIVSRLEMRPGDPSSPWKALLQWPWTVPARRFWIVVLIWELTSLLILIR